MEKIKKTLVLWILLFGILRFVATAPPAEIPGRHGEQGAPTPDLIPSPGQNEPQREHKVEETIQVIKRLGSLWEKFVDFLVELFHFLLDVLNWIDEWESDCLDAFIGFLCLVSLVLMGVGMRVLSIFSTFNR
ncbi:MAG: hypothetical protein QXP27_04800 [Candidatus Methanomethyliaceae archaeon]